VGKLLLINNDSFNRRDCSSELARLMIVLSSVGSLFLVCYIE
jgi:hypothetical protein